MWHVEKGGVLASNLASIIDYQLGKWCRTKRYSNLGCKKYYGGLGVVTSSLGTSQERDKNFLTAVIAIINTTTAKIAAKRLRNERSTSNVGLITVIT